MYIQTLHRFLCFLVLISYTHADAPVSIQQMPGYGNVRPCVSDCIGGNRWMGDYGWEIGAAIGCGTLDPRNDCVCRPDLQAGGEAYLSSCLDRSCAANTIDIASGMSLYTNYCTSAGYNRAAATAAPSGTTGSTPSPGSRTPPGPSQTSGSSSSPDSSDSSGKKLTTPEIIGIAIGGCTLLVAIQQLIYNRETLKRKFHGY